MATEYISQETFDKFRDELDYLTKKRRKEISEQLESAISLGDLSENSEYQETKEQQLNVESRIAELEDILGRVSIISEKTQKSVRIVDLGCHVELKKNGADVTIRYQIVGASEADIMKQKISPSSPMGSALFGRKKGENVKVITPAGELEYTIVEISY
jgi:transcription elongation factor GreA